MMNQLFPSFLKSAALGRFGRMCRSTTLFFAVAVPMAHAGLTINEVDADTAGTDVAEFVEIFDGGVGNTSLTGYVLVFVNGSNDLSYRAIDLDGFTTDENGFFLVANSGVAGADVTFPNDGLQNGADAVALYLGNATDFPNNTAVTTANLTDAIVYGTNDPDDTGLFAALGRSVQYNDTATTSISRAPDGSGVIVLQAPTPGVTNGGTGETIPPVLAAVNPLSPADNATDVPLDANLSLTFDENIMAGTGSVSLYREAGAVDELIQSIPVTSGTISGAMITFNPSADLAPNTSYYVVVPEGAITDLYLNDFAGFTTETAWSFTSTSPDVTAPVPTLYPTDGSNRFLPTASLQLTYDEPVVLGTGVITLTKADNSTQTFDVTGPQVTLVGSTLTIKPTAPLDLSTGYSVQVPAGVVEDSNENPSAAITGTTAWNFTTRGAPSVVINQYYEGDGAGESRFIELRNISGGPVDLTGYRAAAFSSSELAGNQGWKSGVVIPERVTPLDGVILPAGGYYLIAANLAQAPVYAVNNNDLVVSFPSVTSISGTASVVLFSSESYDKDSVEDAVSIVTNEGTNTSFYRLGNGYGFDFTVGTSVTDYSAVWGSATPAEVAAASFGTDIYLTSSQTPETLSLSITPNVISEDDGPEATTATVTRTGPTTEAALVDISTSDSTEAKPTFVSVEIPAGQASETFTIDAVDDGFIDGSQVVTIRVSGSGFIPATQTLTVEDDGVDLPVDIVINEIDSNPDGDDVLEFVELYNNSSTERSLEGLTLVFFNGNSNGDPVYLTVALTGTIPGNGYFVVGNAGLDNVDIVVSDGAIQNGADGVAICVGTPSDFPTGTAAAMVSASLVDALVYGNSNASDDALVAALTPGSIQADESAGAGVVNSLARLPDGGDAFDATLFVAQLPTPGASNVGGGATGFDLWLEANAPGQALDDDHDNDGVPNGVEYVFGLSGSSFTQLPSFDATGTVSFPVDDSVSGVTYRMEKSSTLLPDSWTPVLSTDPEYGEGPDYISFTKGSSPTKLFVRFVVVTP